MGDTLTSLVLGHSRLLADPIRRVTEGVSDDGKGVPSLDWYKVLPGEPVDG